VAPITQIRALYLAGYSSRQIQALLGYSHGYIWRLCRDIARDRVTAARLRQPATSKHWRTCRSVARRRMERQLGRKLRRDEHVHHKDGDFTNNAPQNLEVLQARMHLHLHRPPNPVPRHKRPARQQYMQQYFVAATETATCAICEEPFVRRRYNPRATCSTACRYEMVARSLRGR
jgi:hypothetical protein